ncbi:acyl-CoA reductase [Aquibacillus sediminis]|uniref:acyl-CoA reductase n=1 Tax=Aquibacillus sediminis TaxID=2574734 RepID=UPI001108CAB9|nr:acyl-CoA reductase [Aquibacillus sediminis]
MKIKGYFLPIEPKQTKSLTFSNHGQQVEVEVPILNEQDLKVIETSVKESRQKYIKQLHTSQIIDIIDLAVGKWLNPNYELRRLAEQLLPVITGYDHEMVRLFLTDYLRNFRKQKLQRIVDEDFSNPLVLDEFRPAKAGGLTRAYGPESIIHIFSGNVPALPLWSLVSGLLVKSATIGKVSSSEPLFITLFTQTLAEIDEQFAESIAILWWKGGDEQIERVAFSESEAVIAYGSEQTISDVAKRIPPHVRFLPHGHKVSFGVVTNECLTPTLAWKTAQLAAKDASWFDQQGCLSPHVFYVERGGALSPRDFAHMLAHEMDNVDHKMPRASLSTEEVSAIVKVRSDIEFQSQVDPKVDLLTSDNGTAWTVIYRDHQTEFPFSMLNRVVTVVAIDSVDEVPTLTRDIKDFVQTVGVACPPQRFQALIKLFGECKANRISFLGEMSNPQPGWHHDGRFNLADLVYWCDVEASVEVKMDMFDPFRN